MILEERFLGVKNILQADKDNRRMMTIMVAAIISAVILPAYNLPLLIMIRNSPMLLCFHLNEWENPDDGLWNHSLMYWLLLAFDCLWLYMCSTFVTFLGVMALNLLTGIPLILATLR